MTLPTFPDPRAPMEAVQKVWHDNADLVRRFKLSHAPGGVVENSWYVMVSCDVPDVDAYELGEVLRRLEHLVEKESGMDVSLMLSIKSVESTNGTQS